MNMQEMKRAIIKTNAYHATSWDPEKRIKRLESQIAEVKRMTTKPQEEMSFQFDGGHVEYDADEIRFNIFFNEIPEQEKRNKLKHNGFKWSPRRSAWTRGAKTMPLSFLKSILA